MGGFCSGTQVLLGWLSSHDTFFCFGLWAHDTRYDTGASSTSVRFPDMEAMPSDSLIGFGCIQIHGMALCLFFAGVESLFHLAHALGADIGTALSQRSFAFDSNSAPTTRTQVSPNDVGGELAAFVLVQQRKVDVDRFFYTTAITFNVKK